MTDTPTPDPKPTDFGATVARYFAEQAQYQHHADALRPSNKAVLFDALASAGVTHVIVSFDGYGDSGQVESIEAKNGDEIVNLPAGAISLVFAQWGQAEAAPQNLTVADAVEHMAYDFLRQTHEGWENNDGAYGEFTFDVAERTIALDYNERFTSSENYSHEF